MIIHLLITSTPRTKKVQHHATVQDFFYPPILNSGEMNYHTQLSTLSAPPLPTPTTATFETTEETRTVVVCEFFLVCMIKSFVFSSL